MTSVRERTQLGAGAEDEVDARFVLAIALLALMAEARREDN